jgi:hypothetical protein
MNNLNEAIEKLKGSPLFYLFLSSRELFHSNFWFWLSTLNKEETFKLFSSQLLPENIAFKREHNQTFEEYKSKVDLLISANNQPYVVIENKVKDFPSLDQLQRIKNSFGQIFPEYVLTTLFWSEDISFEGWNIRTYKEISKRINAKAFSDNPYYVSLIEDYKDFTLNLSELSLLLEVSSKYDFAISWNWELYLKLNDIKLWEGYQKLRASHLLNKFQSTADDVLVAYSVNNQKATIDFYINLHEGYSIGIQIEDVQFRKFVSGKNAELFAKKLIQKNLFFNTSFNGRGNKRYLNYGKVFKYQYTRLNPSEAFETLFEKVNQELQEIITNRNCIILNLPSN